MVKKTYSKRDRRSENHKDLYSLTKRSGHQPRKIGAKLHSDSVPTQSRNARVNPRSLLVPATNSHATMGSIASKLNNGTQDSQKVEVMAAKEVSRPELDFFNKPLSEKKCRMWIENQASSPFLRLPVELRLFIYELLYGGQTITIEFVTYGDPDYIKNILGNIRNSPIPNTGYDPCFKYFRTVDVYQNPTDYQRRIPLRTAVPNRILFLNNVCRQLYIETAHLPYSLSDISFKSRHDMFNFLFMERRFTIPQLEAIETIVIREDHLQFNCLSLLKNLRKVYLKGQGWFEVIRTKEKISLVSEENHAFKKTVISLSFLHGKRRR